MVKEAGEIESGDTPVVVPTPPEIGSEDERFGGDEDAINGGDAP